MRDAENSLRPGSEQPAALLMSRLLLSLRFDWTWDDTWDAVAISLGVFGAMFVALAFGAVL